MCQVLIYGMLVSPLGNEEQLAASSTFYILKMGHVLYLGVLSP